MFENYQRKSHLVLLAKRAVYNLSFNELLSTHIVNVARFARNVEEDILGDFQTL